MKPTPTTTAAFTALAMLAFAANSLLCRQALGGGHTDPAAFSVIRVLAGACMLALLILPGRNLRIRLRSSWRAPMMLLGYMLFFSFAYLTLSAGTGALILFGAVQLTMLGAALRAGERFEPLAWLGFVMAIGGLVYLVSPGVTAPDPAGAALMALAGVCWGFYSLLGRNVGDPLGATAANFLYALPLVIAGALPFAGSLQADGSGLLLAVASGALASGIGYAAWYLALRGLTASHAATVQLSVPVIAAAGGVLLLNEALTVRLVLASVATIGGIWIVLARRSARA
ncbi:MAG: DMT family transporter [Pseudomonadales bacterium]